MSAPVKSLYTVVATLSEQRSRLVLIARSYPV